MELFQAGEGCGRGGGHGTTCEGCANGVGMKKAYEDGYSIEGGGS